MGRCTPEKELGWLVYDGYEGQGYATEAAAALRDWAFNPLGVDRLRRLHRSDQSPVCRLGRAPWCCCRLKRPETGSRGLGLSPPSRHYARLNVGDRGRGRCRAAGARPSPDGLVAARKLRRRAAPPPLTSGGGPLQPARGSGPFLGAVPRFATRGSRHRFGAEPVGSGASRHRGGRVSSTQVFFKRTR